MLCPKEWIKEYCEAFNSKRVKLFTDVQAGIFFFVTHSFRELQSELCVKFKKKL
jgi:hypothetical protein